MTHLTWNSTANSKHKINIRLFWQEKVQKECIWQALTDTVNPAISLGLVKECAFSSQTQSNLCCTAVVSGSCCWQFFVIWLCTRVLDSQDSIIWSRRAEKHGDCLSSWKCSLHVDMFSMILLCVVKTELNMTLLVMQTILPAMSHLCHVHTINTKTHCNLALSRSSIQDTSNTLSPPWQTPEFLLTHSMFFLFLFSLVLFFSCHNLILHSSCWKNWLSNYQRLACRLVTLDWVISTNCFRWDITAKWTCKDLSRRH